MNYLSDDEFMTIQDNVRLLSIKGVILISHIICLIVVLKNIMII